jgi:hypothetical protein
VEVEHRVLVVVVAVVLSIEDEIVDHDHHAIEVRL